MFMKRALNYKTLIWLENEVSHLVCGLFPILFQRFKLFNLIVCLGFTFTRFPSPPLRFSNEEKLSSNWIIIYIGKHNFDLIMIWGWFSLPSQNSNLHTDHVSMGLFLSLIILREDDVRQIERKYYFYRLILSSTHIQLHIPKTPKKSTKKKISP